MDGRILTYFVLGPKMPKTRQQRIAEERAGYAPSPPQVLIDKPRGLRRTRAKTPSANSNVAEGPVVPSQQPAAPGPEAPRALVHIWVDENRYVYDPSYEFAISSELVPELALFLEKLRDHGTQNLATSSSSSETQVTPSLNRRQIAHASPISRTEPQLPEPSAPMEAQPASTGIISPSQETSLPIEIRAPSVRTGRPFQQFSDATASLSAPAHVRSPLQETYRSMTPHDSRPARIEAPLEQTAYPRQPTRIDQPVKTISHSATPTHAAPQAMNTSGHSEGIRDVSKIEQTRPMRKSVASLKRPSEASGAERSEKRTKSSKQSAPAPIKRKSPPVPSNPELFHKYTHLPSIFRDNPFLPAYTLDNRVRYGVVEPSDEYLKFHDEAPVNKDSNSENGRTPQTLQASGTSIQGRVIRPTRSVKGQFGFSPLTTISERSESTPPIQPEKSQPPIRFPSRWLDRMNANKRKRWTSPESIPNPKGKGDGLCEKKFYGNAEEDEDKIAEQRPGKVRRTSHIQNISSQGAANPVSSRPCTGQQSITSKTPIPITNAAGSFKVPSPGDSDWSDSQSEDERSSKAATAPSSTTANPGPTSRPQFRANAFSDWLLRAPPAAAAVVQRIEVNQIAAGQTFEAALESGPPPTSPPTSPPRFTAFEDWLQTVSPSAASALERMEVNSNVAGAAFQRGLVNDTTT